ncbi:MAG: phosphoribosylformylglycinamidine synthase I [Phycisphaera sp.]|nr:phosphoribosylformylglycinamidine synthase I [Phycisphaera sp.]
MKPKTLILRTAGTNCDEELAHAFRLAGSDTDKVHLNTLIEQPAMLDGFDMLGLPGGFSYGDDIAAGRIFANRLRHRLYDALRTFVAAGKPVIGICNGFQLMVKAGLLPAFELPEGAPPKQVVTLTDNAKPRFVDRWVGLRVDADTRCVWTAGLGEFELPIAHGEGRFVADDDVLNKLEEQGQVALRYTDNPNGSLRDIAGLCDPTGLVFGLMPHPERFTHITNHPRWTRETITSPAGLQMFRNAVAHVTSDNGAPAGA